MKKALLFTFALCLTGFLASAQDAGKLAKKASRDLSTYNLDPTGNADKMTSALEQINEAFALAPEDADVLLTRAEIYQTLSTKQAMALQLGQEVDMKGGNSALIALNSFTKYLGMADKKWQKKKAIEGIAAVQNSLNSFGAKSYEAKEYAAAFESFKGQLASHKVLKENSEASVLDEEGQYDNQVYITALSAMLNNDFDSAMPFLTELYKTGNAQAAVYQGLYQGLAAKGKDADAKKYLEEGRIKHPDDTGLLFDEINIYLKEGKLDELTTRLKTAIEKEPDNVSLYQTLASVYDNLYGSYTKEGNTAKAAEYFTLAKNTYNTAIEKNPSSGDAYYGLGALYYNKAASKTQAMQALSEDYSMEATKKLEVMQKEVSGLFNEALPFFKKAEMLNPNDQNTLIALKEIAARTNDFEASKEFKARLEKVQAGGSNDKPYYKN